MRIVPTERDRYNVAKHCWDAVKGLTGTRKYRKLLATQLELHWWKQWRAEQQAKEDS
jgi:hypothetical protein